MLNDDSCNYIRVTIEIRLVFDPKVFIQLNYNGIIMVINGELVTLNQNNWN